MRAAVLKKMLVNEQVSSPVSCMKMNWERKKEREKKINP